MRRVKCDVINLVTSSTGIIYENGYYHTVVTQHAQNFQFVKKRREKMNMRTLSSALEVFDEGYREGKSHENLGISYRSKQGFHLLYSVTG
jgi:hypothetical protein